MQIELTSLTELVIKLENPGGTTDKQCGKSNTASVKASKFKSYQHKQRTNCKPNRISVELGNLTLASKLIHSHTL